VYSPGCGLKEVRPAGAGGRGRRVAEWLGVHRGFGVGLGAVWPGQRQTPNENTSTRHKSKTAKRKTQTETAVANHRVAPSQVPTPSPASPTPTPQRCTCPGARQSTCTWSWCSTRWPCQRRRCSCSGGAPGRGPRLCMRARAGLGGVGLPLASPGWVACGPAGPRHAPRARGAAQTRATTDWPLSSGVII
jgi:hypothetical protein